jgi:hypothetical protein
VNDHDGGGHGDGGHDEGGHGDGGDRDLPLDLIAPFG